MRLVAKSHPIMLFRVQDHHASSHHFRTDPEMLRSTTAIAERHHALSKFVCEAEVSNIEAHQQLRLVGHGEPHVPMKQAGPVAYQTKHQASIAFSITVLQRAVLTLTRSKVFMSEGDFDTCLSSSPEEVQRVLGLQT